MAVKPDTISITIQDANNKDSVLSVFVPSAFVASPAHAEWLDFLNSVESLTDGRITKISRSVNIALTGYGLALAEAAMPSDVQEGLRMIFETGFPSYPTFTIPAYNETATLANTHRVDETNPAVDSLILAAIAMGMTDSHGEDVTLFAKGYEVFAGKKVEEVA